MMDKQTFKSGMGLLGTAILVSVLFVRAGFPGDIPHMGRETVAGHISLKKGFNWHYGYEIEFRNKQVIVRSVVNLVPGKGVRKIELDRVKKEWEQGIEQTWSKKYAIQSPTGETYPVVVDVSFRGPLFHHDVVVRPGGGCCSDELNWHILDTPVTIAHEFGHMLGLYDEYGEGALDPETKIIDPTSIMTSRPKHGKVYPRHLKRVLDWFKGKTKSEDYLLAVWEPESRRNNGSIPSN